MAIVVNPVDPLANLPQSMAQFSQGLAQLGNNITQHRDIETLKGVNLSGMSPGQLLGLAGQMKNPQIRAALSNAALTAQLTPPTTVMNDQGQVLGQVHGPMKVIKTGTPKQFYVPIVPNPTKPSDYQLQNVPDGAAIPPNSMTPAVYSNKFVTQPSADTRQAKTLDMQKMNYDLNYAKFANSTPELQKLASAGDPHAKQLLDDQAKYQAYLSEAKATGTAKGQEAGSDPGAVKYAGDQILVGNNPNLGMMGQGMRSAVWSYVQKRIDSAGDTPQGLALRTAAMHSYKGALDTQVKGQAALDSFVQNQGEQVDMLTKPGGALDQLLRTDAKLVNVPLAKVAQVVKGSAAEAKVKEILTEVATESAKIAGGAQQSIREPSAQMAERWTNILDGTMPVGQLKEVLEQTKQLAQVRKKSVDDAVNRIQSEITGLGRNITQGTARKTSVSARTSATQVNPVTHKPMKFNPQTYRWESVDESAR